MNKLFLFLLLFYTLKATATEVDMQNFNLLRNGMTEAEVLYRIGSPNHKTIKGNHYNDIVRKTWFYIPAKSSGSNKKWITELRFNADGYLISRDRYRINQ